MKRCEPDSVTYTDAQLVRVGYRPMTGDEAPTVVAIVVLLIVMLMLHVLYGLTGTLLLLASFVPGFVVLWIGLLVCNLRRRRQAERLYAELEKSERRAAQLAQMRPPG